jgi:hypothetical protein
MEAFVDAVIEIYKGLRPDLDKVLSTYKAYSWDEVFEETYKVVKEVVEK